jgi:hypothetical protein
LIIKLDSWHLFMLDEIKQCYPETPLIFMYRQPHEIEASHRKRPGMQAVPGLLEPEIFGFSGNEETNPDQYLRQVLTKMFHKIITGCEKNKKHLLLCYNAGVRENFKTVANFLEISFTSEEQEAAENRLQYHSKHPHERFEIKDCQEPGTGMKELEDLYRSLEIIRLNQPT